MATPLPQPSTEAPSAPSKYRQHLVAKPLKRWHEAIIDDLLAFPRGLLKERAARLGYSPEYLSIIMNSDMFKAAYAARREQFNAILNTALAQKLGGIAELGLDIMKDQLESKRTSIPFQAVSETTLSVLDKLGFGSPKGGGTQVNVSVSGQGGAVPVVSAERLDAARQRLRDSENAKLIEASPSEALSSPQPRLDEPLAYPSEAEAATDREPGR